METLEYQDDLVGNYMTFGPDDHQGADSVYINIVENGAWKKVHEE